MGYKHFNSTKRGFSFSDTLAKEYKLPIVIHCRNAFDEVFEILEIEKSEDLFGIFHCFTGNEEQAKQAISYNMKLGIGGVVTYKNGNIDKFLSQIDLSHIVLETDAPYLSPVPFRGKRNESAYLLHIVEKVADIYGKEKKETVTPLVAAQEWITHFILAMYGPSVVYNFKYLYTMRHNDYVPETVASGDFMAKQRPITMAWRLFYLFRTVFLPYYILIKENII